MLLNGASRSLSSREKTNDLEEAMQAVAINNNNKKEEKLGLTTGCNWKRGELMICSFDSLFQSEKLQGPKGIDD